MKHLARRLPVNVILLLVISLFLSPATSFSAGEMLNQPGLSILPGSEVILRDENSILLRYTQTLGGPRNGQESPSLMIYKDGYIRVFYPDYLKQAGTYAATIDQDSLDQLWQMLTDKRLLEFDAIKVRDIMALHDQAGSFHASEIRSVSDAPTIFIEFYPNRYLIPGMLSQGDANEQKTISWHALKWAASQYSEITEIQQLYAVHQQLERIMRQSDLVKVNETQ